MPDKVHKRHELSVKQLKRKVKPSLFNFTDSSELESLDEIIGQERAVNAIRFGLGMDDPGFNIYVSGWEGTGKRTIINDIVSKLARSDKTPDDMVVINNFRDPFHPKVLSVAPGKGNEFSRSMDRIVRKLEEEVPAILEGQSFLTKREEYSGNYENQKKDILTNLERVAAQKNIVLQNTESGIIPAYEYEGEVLSPEKYAILESDLQNEIQHAIQQVQVFLENAYREIGRLEREYIDKVEDLIDSLVRATVQRRFALMREEYPAPEFSDYFQSLTDDIIENLDLFISDDAQNSAEQYGYIEIKSTRRYKVNVLISHYTDSGAPVIIEENPSITSLFGSIERKVVATGVAIDFTMMQPGALLKANGGYLLIDTEAILRNLYLWDNLKKMIRSRSTRIEDYTEETSNPTSFKSESIPLKVKIILYGEPHHFDALMDYDAPFTRNFKVRADFDYETDYSDEYMLLFARFVARVVRYRDLRHFTPDAIIELVAYGQRIAENQNRLSLQFGSYVNVISEANYRASQDQSPVVKDIHVKQTLNEIRARHSLTEKKMHQYFTDGIYEMDVHGEGIGQVNALTVIDTGDFSFGQPNRISAVAYLGETGIVQIDRESEMTGRIHNKGFLTIQGFLGNQFAQEFPLSVNVSISFEQSYGGIEGDSASSTELFAVLSALSGLPVNLSLGVTGSVNQFGGIQAVGGVNEKIEGFFHICQLKGLNSRQGVIIPKSNENHLMLADDVIEAVAQGQFHIYSIATIDEGVELLMGRPVGKKNKKGIYPKESVYGRVLEQLKYYYERSIANKQDQL